MYSAGLPQATIDSVSEVAGSTFASGEKYDYKVEYEYKDAKGNQITGQLSAVSSVTLSATKDLQITVDNLDNSGGYNIDQAIVSGNQSSVTTITVDSGHGLKANDSIYVVNQATSAVVQRTVSSTTSTTITIGGAAIDVNDNDVISNVKISIYRTDDYQSSRS